MLIVVFAEICVFCAICVLFGQSCFIVPLLPLYTGRLLLYPKGDRKGRHYGYHCCPCWHQLRANAGTCPVPVQARVACVVRVPPAGGRTQ
jgi:hypothetical protein